MTDREKLAVALCSMKLTGCDCRAAGTSTPCEAGRHLVNSFLPHLHAVGLAVVPRKPTEGMIEAAEKPHAFWTSFRAIYANMIAAGEVK